MDKVLSFMEMIFTDYFQFLLVGMFLITFLLMIMNLNAVRRCRKQILILNEKTKEMTRLALKQNEETRREGRNKILEKQMDKTPYGGKKYKNKEDEELFGSVIQEMFP